VNGEPSAPRTGGQQATVERGGLWGLMFSFAGLLLLPYSAALSVLGIVQGARARRKARAQGTQAPGSIASIVVGVIGILWALLLTAALAVFSDELRAYGECTARAHTVSAQEKCDDAYFDAVGDRFPDQPWVRDLLENGRANP